MSIPMVMGGIYKTINRSVVLVTRPYRNGQLWAKVLRVVGHDISPRALGAEFWYHAKDGKFGAMEDIETHGMHIKEEILP